VLTSSPLLIALMQTAATLPVLLFGLPAGAMADIFDRRRLLLFWAAWMLVVAAVLSGFTVAGWLGPGLLLVLTCLLNVGAAMNGPTWQAIVPELVPREQLPVGIALNSAGFNLARAVGPALGGLTVAAFASVWFGAGLVFSLNALSFIAVLVVIYRWKRTPFFKSALPAERLLGSMRSGLRYTPETISITGPWATAFSTAASAWELSLRRFGCLGPVSGFLLMRSFRDQPLCSPSRCSSWRGPLIGCRSSWC